MDNKNKGFTLIEIIITIVIVITITTVAVGSYIGISNQKKKEEWRLVKDQIETAAEQYFSSNKFLYEELDDSSTLNGTISVGTLVSKDYLNKVVDPRDKKEVNKCTVVEVTINNGKYTGKYKDDNNSCDSFNKIEISENGAAEINVELVGTPYNGWYNYNSSPSGLESILTINKGKKSVASIIYKINGIESDLTGTYQIDNVKNIGFVRKVDNTQGHNDISYTVTNNKGKKTIFIKEYKLDNVPPAINDFKVESNNKHLIRTGASLNEIIANSNINNIELKVNKELNNSLSADEIKKNVRFENTDYTKVALNSIGLNPGEKNKIERTLSSACNKEYCLYRYLTDDEKNNISTNTHYWEKASSNSSSKWYVYKRGTNPVACQFKKTGSSFQLDGNCIKYEHFNLNKTNSTVTFSKSDSSLSSLLNTYSVPRSILVGYPSLINGELVNLSFKLDDSGNEKASGLSEYELGNAEYISSKDTSVYDADKSIGQRLERKLYYTNDYNDFLFSSNSTSNSNNSNYNNNNDVFKQITFKDFTIENTNITNKFTDDVKSSELKKENIYVPGKLDGSSYYFILSVFDKAGNVATKTVEYTKYNNCQAENLEEFDSTNDSNMNEEECIAPTTCGKNGDLHKYNRGMKYTYDKNSGYICSGTKLDNSKVEIDVEHESDKCAALKYECPSETIPPAVVTPPSEPKPEPEPDKKKPDSKTVCQKFKEATTDNIGNLVSVSVSGSKLLDYNLTDVVSNDKSKNRVRFIFTGKKDANKKIRFNDNAVAAVWSSSSMVEQTSWHNGWNSVSNDDIATKDTWCVTNFSCYTGNHSSFYVTACTMAQCDTTKRRICYVTKASQNATPTSGHFTYVGN